MDRRELTQLNYFPSLSETKNDYEIKWYTDLGYNVPITPKWPRIKRYTISKYCTPTRDVQGRYFGQCHRRNSGVQSPQRRHRTCREDREITGRLKEAGELLGIKVLDHVIVATDMQQFVATLVHKKGPKAGTLCP